MILDPPVGQEFSKKTPVMIGKFQAVSLNTPLQSLNTTPYFLGEMSTDKPTNRHEKIQVFGRYLPRKNGSFPWRFVGLPERILKFL